MTVTTRPRPATAQATPAQLRRYFAMKLSAELGPHDLKRLLEAPGERLVVLDVRSREGYRQAHIPGALNIPFEDLPKRMAEFPKPQAIITYCWDVTCTLSTKAAYVLTSRGYRAKELLGGIEAWQKAGFPIEQ